jgi:ComF family protein
MSALLKISEWCLGAVDLVLPPRCIGSGEIVGRQGAVSPFFFSTLAFIDDPMCDRCGTPFGFETPAGSLCGHCMESEPRFDRARAAVVYNDASAGAILAFKYGDRMHAAKTFAPWLLRAAGGMMTATDFIIPVPLHPKRLWTRRFNQSAVLAQELSQISGRLCLPDALLRPRCTVPQKGLSRHERSQNVRGAFSLNPRHAEKIKGRNIMIVDDVFTSGATLNECARTLKQAGVENVFVLTLARATREDFA